MRCLVPEADDRLGQGVLIAHRAEGGRVEHKETARPRLYPEPARGEHAEEVAAREDQHVPLRGTDAAYHAVGPGPDVFWRLPAGTAVAKELPVGALGVD